jgi:nucleoside-diphosphate-sugar epimerase
VVVHQLTALAEGNSVDNARIRREGTRNLVDAATAAGVRRLVVQSIAWAYEPGDTPATEETPLDLSADGPRAVTVGGVHALETQAAEMDHVVLRYGTFYGPGTWYRPDDRVGRQFRDGGFTATDAVTSFVHVEDAAIAAAAALRWPAGIYNIADDEPAPALEWAPVLAAVLGAPRPPVSAGRAGWERGADNSLSRTKLDWQPRYASWREGFATLS